MSRKQATLTPTTRVEDLATARELGAWERSDRVNTRLESSWLINFVPLAIIAIVGLSVVPFVSGLPWWGRILLISVLLVLGAIGVLGVLVGIDARRIGALVVHRFVEGFVLDRTRGAVVATTYSEVSARLLAYREPGDSTSDPRDHVALHVTFPDGSSWAMAEEVGSPSYPMLIELAERCGAHDSVPVEYRDAVDLLSRERWA